MTQLPSRRAQGGLRSAPLIPAKLARTRGSARLAISFERIWPRLLPALLTLGLFAVVAWIGLLRLMPDWGRLGLVALFGVAFAFSLYPLRFFRSPEEAEIDRRIEASNNLTHSPLLVQSDQPAVDGGPFSRALWREHQARMEAQLKGLRGVAPRPRVPERDPWGLRAAVVLVLVAAFAFSFGPSGGSLRDAFRAPARAQALPPRIDAWVTPPAYTGVAPIFLPDTTAGGVNAFTVPENSVVSLQMTGGSGGESLELADAAGTRAWEAKVPDGVQDKAEPVQTEAIVTRQFSGVLDTDGALSLRDGERDLRHWRFAVTPDRAPAIRFIAEPRRAANGTLELSYEISDDYGAASAASAFALEDAPKAGARPLYGPPEMPLTLPRRGAKSPAAKASRDLTEHVWAGSTVSLTLTATDAAKHQGSTPAKRVVLPEHPFTNPLAKALIEQRKMLGMDVRAKPRVMELMDAVTLRPEDTFPVLSHYLAMMSARSRLEMAETDDQLREVVDYLWEVAIGIEQGDLSDAQKRLAKAQDALKQALENNASDEEIDRLMKELREAMREFLREFAEQAQKNPNLSQTMPQDGQELRPQDLDRMMKQIEEMAKSGNRDAAQELLSQLQEMMNNLEAGQPQQGQQGQQSSEMRQQMDKLGEIMRKQQELMNETFRTQRGQEGMQQGEGGQQGENGDGRQPGEGQNQRPMTPEEFAQALKSLQEGQGQLQRDLQALQKGMEGMGMQPGEGFGEAGREMGRAQGSLGEGDGERAVGEQGRALEALRRGAQDMMQQMMQAMQGEEGGSEQGGRQQSSDRDPLGRPRATNGPDAGGSTRVPDEIDVQRARRILEAIRKRLGDALSPELERSYLERLLEMR